MQLPRKVRVGDRWYSIEVVEALREKRLAGKVNYRNCRITLGERVGEHVLTSDERSEAFWHEATHAILDDMAHPLRNNEAFVTAFAQRLARAINSTRSGE